MCSAVLAVLHTAWRTELFKQFHGYQAVPWLRRLVRPLSAEAQVRARDMGFVVVKVEMRQVNLEFFGFTPSVSFHSISPYSYHLEDEQ
jgi:hypothetical protein